MAEQTSWACENSVKEDGTAKMKHSKTVLNGILLLTVCFVGCGPTFNMASYKKAHESAATGVPVAREMEELFGEADHFITNFAHDYKPKTWNTEVYFGGRYRLAMQVRVKIDYWKNVVTQIGEPKFYLRVAKDIQMRNGEARIMNNIGQDQIDFSENEWRVLRDSGGDVAAIGLKSRPNPVEHFDEYAENVRSHRVPITLTGNKETLRRYKKWRKENPAFF